MLLEYLFLLILGLVFGSFVTAISWRIPREISFVKGRSICPNCRNKISWYDNIPLLSYIILGGKCRNCKIRISFRYPLIEMATALGFVAIFYFTNTFGGLTLQSISDVFTLVLYLVVFLILLTIFIIDLGHQIIPDSLTFAGILVIGFYLLLTASNSIFNVAFSGFLAAAFLLFVHLVTKGKGMGLGDVKFAVLGGMIVSLKLMPIWLFLSFLTGATVGIILILIGKAKMKTKIAFGPFLTLGIALTLAFGNNIIRLIGLE